MWFSDGFSTRRHFNFSTLASSFHKILFHILLLEKNYKQCRNFRAICFPTVRNDNFCRSVWSLLWWQIYEFHIYQTDLDPSIGLHIRTQIGMIRPCWTRMAKKKLLQDFFDLQDVCSTQMFITLDFCLTLNVRNYFDCLNWQIYFRKKLLYLRKTELILRKNNFFYFPLKYFFIKLETLSKEYNCQNKICLQLWFYFNPKLLMKKNFNWSFEETAHEQMFLALIYRLLFNLIN